MDNGDFVKGACLLLELTNGEHHYVILDGFSGSYLIATALVDYDDDDRQPDDWDAPGETAPRLYPLSSIVYAEWYGALEAHA